jgi:hypothetical protein
MLYSDEPSRPNAAVNILVGAEILKVGVGTAQDRTRAGTWWRALSSSRVQAFRCRVHSSYRIIL